MFPLAIAISDNALTQLIQLTASLTPDARSALLLALADELRSVPQPVGDGEVSRAVRKLLATGMFHREQHLVADGAAHYGVGEGKYRKRVGTHRNPW
jgi:hypothetical protein